MFLLVLIAVALNLAPWLLGGSVVALIYASFSQNHARGYRLAVAATIAVSTPGVVTAPLWVPEGIGRDAGRLGLRPAHR